MDFRTEYKFNQSTLSFDEWIRLNDIDNPHILEACDTIAEQERIIEEQEEEIYQLKALISSFDFKTVYVELDWITCNDKQGYSNGNIERLTKIIDNFELRTKDI